MIPESSDSPGELIWCGDCLACEAPEGEAPQLLAKLSKTNTDTYFVQQPTSPNEINAACRALQSCCVSALRYAGKDRKIISQLGNNPQYCDYIIGGSGQLVRTLDDFGELLPFAVEMQAKLNGWDE